jgi:glycosyltransferase involved in cell wall biosynthesis
MRVALLSYCCDSGVGIAGYDFFRHLPFAKWIVVPHRILGVMAKRLDSRCHVLPRELEPDSLEECFDGVDALFCIERGYYPNLFRSAKKKGLQIMLMPNAEWFNPASPEISAVDKFMAPTAACFEMLTKYENLRGRSVYIPHPIDTERFKFRLRERANVFIHCHGWGGYKERKGTDIVLRAARACPEISFIVRTQEDIGETPKNVAVYGPTMEPEEQYSVGDICIQPSRWEGVGLQILEAMSCGLPTIVPDAQPMNEYHGASMLHIPAHSSPVKIAEREWVQWEMDDRCLANKLRELRNQSIAELSIRARRSVEARSWSSLATAYLHALGMC